jgi:hypothetical protein
LIRFLNSAIACLKNIDFVIWFSCGQCAPTFWTGSCCPVPFRSSPPPKPSSHLRLFLNKKATDTFPSILEIVHFYHDFQSSRSG